MYNDLKTLTLNHGNDERVAALQSLMRMLLHVQINLKLSCYLTLFHLCYYVLTNRIRELKTLVGSNINFRPKASNLGWIVTEKSPQDG